jgi:hypothetical protein
MRALALYVHFIATHYIAHLQRRAWDAKMDEAMAPSPASSRTYDDRVHAILTREFGAENGNILAKDNGVRRIIRAYEAEGLSAEQAAHYVALKLKCGPKNEAELEIQKELADEFEKHGVDFMTMDPDVHYTILQEAMLFKRVPRTVQMFFEIAEQIGDVCADADSKATRLAEIYRTRLDILQGPGKTHSGQALPAHFRTFQ